MLPVSGECCRYYDRECGTVTEEQKRCSHCKKTKPLSEFNKNRHCGDGFHSECKTCKNLRYQNAHPKLCVDCGTDITRQHRRGRCIECAKKRSSEYMKQYLTEHPKRYNCRGILEKHHDDLKNDPERLSTEFIILLSQRDREESVEP